MSADLWISGLLIYFWATNRILNWFIYESGGNWIEAYPCNGCFGFASNYSTIENVCPKCGERLNKSKRATLRHRFTLFGRSIELKPEATL